MAVPARCGKRVAKGRLIPCRTPSTAYRIKPKLIQSSYIPMSQVIQQTLGPQHLLLTVTINRSEFEPTLNKRLKEYGANIKVNGFRPGHVPMGIVRGRVGNAILAEEINERVDKAMNEFIEGNNQRIIGRPLQVMDNPPAPNINALEDYHFQFEVAFFPEIEVQGIDNSEVIDHHVLPVGDEELNEKWEAIRKEAATLEDTDDQVEADDLFSVSLQEIENGTPKPGGYSRDAVMLAYKDLREYYQAAFVGKKPGESVEIEDILSLDTVSNEANVRKYILDLPKETPLPGALRATITGVRRPVPAVVNEAFLSRYFPPNVTNEEEARELLRKGISQSKNQVANALLHDRLVLHLMQHNPLDLPMDFMRKLIRENNENRLSEEALEANLGYLMNTVHWSNIKRTLGEQFQVNVATQDIDSYIWSYMQAQFGFVNQQFFDQFAQRFYDDEKFIQDAAEEIFESKVLSYVSGMVTRNTMETTEEAILEMRRAVRKEVGSYFAPPSTETDLLDDPEREPSLLEPADNLAGLLEANEETGA